MFQPSKLNPWPIAIIIGLCIVVSVNGFMFFLSQLDPYELVTENYYQKALRYESVVRAQEITRQFGWNFSFSSAHKQGKTQLSVNLTDREKRTIDGLQGSVSLFRPSAARLDRQLDLIKTDSSLYKSDYVSLKSGPWELTFVFKDTNHKVVFYKKMHFVVSSADP